MKTIKKLLYTLLFLTIILAGITNAFANERIRATGSSTVYPFVTVAAEEFGRTTNYKTPIVESIGTGGGFKLFCSGNGSDTPDLSNASRAIKTSERKLCKQNNVNDITEIKIGYDGIVIANSINAQNVNFTKKQIFLALARKIPSNGKLIDNNIQKWSDIDKSLPDTKIEVYGPPPTSGTRDAFVELVMEEACEEIPEFKAAYTDKEILKKNCHLLREDGAFVESGENDNLIVQKLINNHDAFGIFGFSFLEENAATVQGSLIEGIAPEFENISEGSYSIARPLFVYLKDSHLNATAGLREFAKQLVSNKLVGTNGLLVQRGLIPLSQDELASVQKTVNSK